MKRILGFDPGSRIAGFGILDNSPRGVVYVEAGSLALVGETMSERLADLFVRLTTLIEIHQPHEMAIESLFVYKNVSSALKLAQARGVGFIVAGLAKIPVFEYAPRQVKLAVGIGSADKAAVQHMIKHILKLDIKLKPDMADALAIALCHAHLKSSWGAMIENPVGKRRARRSRSLWASIIP